ncbi:MAG: hypothetical protein QM479_14920 [Pseudomonadota bacterium]
MKLNLEKLPKFMLISYLFAIFLICNSVAISISIADENQVIEIKKEKKWWHNRQENKDIYYPHNIHKQAMEEEGDSCMLCHSFAKNTLKNEQYLKHLTTIANEPLEAICHDCHLSEIRAPWRCNICHTDKTTIWPENHNYDYIHQHNEDARDNENQCRSCHIDIAFCSNCHFRRGAGQQDYHPLGYQSRHGIDARMMASQCGRCHNSFYCKDCHRYKK